MKKKPYHDSMVDMEVMELAEVEVGNDKENEIRKSNLRDYLEIFGYMDDTI